MKTEKFFEIFTELDDDLIENALPKERESKRPAARPVLFKALAMGAAAAACCAVFIGINATRKQPIIAPAPTNSELQPGGAGDLMAGGVISGGNSNDTLTYPINESTQPAAYSTPYAATVPAPGGDEVKYSVELMDWRVYETVEELVEAGDVIVSGKITDVSFALIDPTTGNPADKGYLSTVYEVNVTTSYKGFSEKTLKFSVRGGLRDYKTEEQLKLMPKEAQYIPILAETPDIKVGGEYLFILDRYNDAMPTIICPEQTAFALDDHTPKYAGITVDDIIAYLKVDTIA